MRSARSALGLSALLVVASGCTLDFSQVPPRDAGLDARRADAGSADAATTDLDVPATDVGPQLDVGPSDSSRPDAASPDATVDTGTDGGRDADAGGCDDAADCDDGEACTEDVCSAGACVNRPVVCDDGDPCTVDGCSPTTGTCTVVGAPDDTPCGSLRVCCAGACIDVGSDDTSCGACGRSCGANADCTGGTCACTGGFLDCDGAPGCEADPRVDPRHCGTCATACAVPTPSCISGVCRGCTTAADCPSDSLFCTQSPMCTAGACVYPIRSGSCVIDGECESRFEPSRADDCLGCDPDVSQTEWTVLVGEPCSGLYCMTGETCSASGACVGGSPRSCDDGDACTTDSCDEMGRTCRHVPIAGWCHISGTCRTDGTVNPSNECQVCDPARSQTAWSPVAAGTSCDDSNACTHDDRCDGAGQCADSTPNGAGDPCNDGSVCTREDACDGAGSCSGVAIGCNDGLPCTDDVCSEAAGGCTFPIISGCLIGGACVAAGATGPSSCVACVPTTSTTTWSPVADCTSCEMTGFCCGGACQVDPVCAGAACI